MQEKNDVKEEVAVSDSVVLNDSFSSPADDVLSPSVGIKKKYFIILSSACSTLFRPGLSSLWFRGLFFCVC